MSRRGYAKATILIIAGGSDGFERKRLEAKQVPAAFSSGESVAPGMGNLTNTPDRRDAWTNSETGAPDQNAAGAKSGVSIRLQSQRRKSGRSA